MSRTPSVREEYAALTARKPQGRAGYCCRDQVESGHGMIEGLETLVALVKPAEML